MRISTWVAAVKVWMDGGDGGKKYAFINLALAPVLTMVDAAISSS
jgi:hypothetical protein